MSEADHLYVVPVCPRCRGQAQQIAGPLRRMFGMSRWLCVACGHQWDGEPDYVYAEETA